LPLARFASDLAENLSKHLLCRKPAITFHETFAVFQSFFAFLVMIAPRPRLGRTRLKVVGLAADFVFDDLCRHSR
jgi:hypothetical protein